MPRRVQVTPTQDEARVVKREGLKLAQLVNYDDLLTDALVDKVYFWARIRKNRSRYFASRSIREEDVTNILRQSVIIEKDAAKACTQLLDLPGLKHTYGSLSKDDQEHFHKHLRKYVDMYLPDCPFEVSTTNRYTIDTQEAAATARKPIRKGEIIKYLVGIQVAITREEEQTLGLSLQDFSIVMSSRKGTQSLFLGPARFANHDCSANARLTPKGPHSMTVIASRDITIGEEITVSYGDDYFGIENCECLCATCESFGRNGWDPTLSRNNSDDEGENEEVDDEDELSRDENGHARARRKTARPGASPKLPVALQLQAEECKTAKTEATKHLKGVKSRLSHVKGAIKSLEQLQASRESFLISGATDLSSKPHQSELETTTDLAREKANLETYVEQIQSQIATIDAEYSSINSQTGPFKIPDTPSTKRKLDDSSPYTSPHPIPKHPRLEELRNSPLPRSPSRLRQELQLDRDATDAGVGTRGSSLGRSASSSPSARRSQSQSRLSTPATSLSDRAIQDLGDANQAKAASPGSLQASASEVKGPGITRLTRSSLACSRHSGYSSSPKIIAEDEDGNSGDPTARRPGDYTLTSRLLGTPYSRWVECRVCEEYYVQTDSYHLRWSCPRCERHSKLHGYQWPKADKDGKHDTEERVLDHRIVNRFFAPEEVKSIKRGRGTKPILLDFGSEDTGLADNGAKGVLENGTETNRVGRKRGRKALEKPDSEQPDHRKKLKEARGDEQFSDDSTETTQKTPKRRSALRKLASKNSDAVSPQLYSTARRSTRGLPRGVAHSQPQVRAVRTKRADFRSARLEERRTKQLSKTQNAPRLRTGLRREATATLDSTPQSKSVPSKMWKSGQDRLYDKYPNTDGGRDRGTSMSEPQRKTRSLLSAAIGPPLINSDTTQPAAKRLRDVDDIAGLQTKFVRSGQYVGRYTPSNRGNWQLLRSNSEVNDHGDESRKGIGKWMKSTVVTPQQKAKKDTEYTYFTRQTTQKAAIKVFLPEFDAPESSHLDPHTSESSDEERPATATRGSQNQKRRSVQEMIRDANIRRFGFATSKKEEKGEKSPEPEVNDDDVAAPRSIPRRKVVLTVSDLVDNANRRRFDFAATDPKKTPVPGKLTTPSRSKRFKASVARP